LITDPGTVEKSCTSFPVTTCPCSTYIVARYLHAQPYGPKIIQYQICSCKRQPITCQLHSD
jgi:hypothetical protein